MDDTGMQAVRDLLAEKALADVPFDGWSMAVLRQAARDEGLDESMAERAFPGGAVEAVAHFSALADRRLEVEAASADLEQMKLDARIVWLVRHRLEPWSDHREALRRAIALLTLPGNAKVAWRTTWQTADTIWHAANDRSADFSYYTKRVMVSAIFTATVMYWLADESEGAAETWAFLERRVADAIKITKARRQFGIRAGRFGRSFSGLLSPRSRRRFGISG